MLTSCTLLVPHGRLALLRGVEAPSCTLHDGGGDGQARGQKSSPASAQPSQARPSQQHIRLRHHEHHDRHSIHRLHASYTSCGAGTALNAEGCCPTLLYRPSRSSAARPTRGRRARARPPAPCSSFRRVHVVSRRERKKAPLPRRRPSGETGDALLLYRRTAIQRGLWRDSLASSRLAPPRLAPPSSRRVPLTYLASHSSRVLHFYRTLSPAHTCTHSRALDLLLSLPTPSFNIFPFSPLPSTPPAPPLIAPSCWYYSEPVFNYPILDAQSHSARSWVDATTTTTTPLTTHATNDQSSPFTSHPIQPPGLSQTPSLPSLRPSTPSGPTIPHITSFRNLRLILTPLSSSLIAEKRLEAAYPVSITLASLARLVQQEHPTSR